MVLKAVSGCLLCKETLDESLKADPVKCHEVRRIAALRQWSLRVKPTKHGTLTVSKAEASLCLFPYIDFFFFLKRHLDIREID